MKDTNTTKNSVDDQLAQQQSLINAQMRLDIERMKTQVTSDRVEQSRRNVEVISRVINSFTDNNKDIATKMKEVLMENLEILKEVKNIK